MKKHSLLLLALAVLVTINACKKASSSQDPQTSGDNSITLTGTASLSVARGFLAAAAAGTKIVFAGGQGTNANPWSDAVDIYDISTGTWTTAKLSAPRNGLVAAAAGNKILFAGGEGNQTIQASDVVDIYDVSTNTWTTAKLSEGRMNLAAAAVGNKIVFAGGEKYINLDAPGSHPLVKSKTVDIYDVSTNTWTTAQLSSARSHLSAAGAGNKILIAGGIDENFVAFNTVDIYDVSTNTWTTSAMSQPHYGMAAAGSGNKIVFVGGLYDLQHILNTTAEIYDVATNSWTLTVLSANGVDQHAAATAGNKIVFAGGANSINSVNPTVITKVANVYDVTTNKWTTLQLTDARALLAGAGIGNTLLFGGGAYDIYGTSPSKTVEIFKVSN